MMETEDDLQPSGQVGYCSRLCILALNYKGKLESPKSFKCLNTSELPLSSELRQHVSHS